MLVSPSGLPALPDGLVPTPLLQPVQKQATFPQSWTNKKQTISACVISECSSLTVQDNLRKVHNVRGKVARKKEKEKRVQEKEVCVSVCE